MVSGPCRYERLVEAAKHQATDAEDHKVNIIGRCDMYSRSYTCCVGKNWRLLLTTVQLCDVKGFRNSYEAITNVPVGKTSTAVLHDDVAVYIFIINEDLFFGKYMDH